MGEQPKPGKPYTTGSKRKYATAEDFTLITTRVNKLSEGMQKLYEGQKAAIDRLETNQGTITKVLAEMRGVAPGASGQATGQQGQGQTGQWLGLVRDLTRPPNPLNQLVTMMLRESIMFQRTLRYGIMKRLKLTDLFAEEGGTGKSGTNSEDSIF